MIIIDIKEYIKKINNSESSWLSTFEFEILVERVRHRDWLEQMSLLTDKN